MKKFIQAWHEDKVNPLDDVLVRWLLLLGMVDARKQRVYEISGAWHANNSDNTLHFIKMR